MTTEVDTTTAELPVQPVTARMTTDAPREPWRTRVRQVLTSARARILLWYIALIALALLATTFTVRQILLVELTQTIRADLVQEANELRLLARGSDPRSGTPFQQVGEVQPVLRLFLQRSIPSANETMFTYANGTDSWSSSQPAQVPIEVLRDLPEIRRFADYRGAVAQFGSAETERGRVDFLAQPISYTNPRTNEPVSSGVLIAVEFTDVQRAQIERIIRTAAGVGLAVLVFASIVAWGVAGRIIAPVTLVTDTARSISESDLSRRIEVAGRDEISRLAATFNAMLDRLEIAFAAQRNFIDDAGHELRTPITIIRGHLELLDDDPIEREETIAIVTDELDRMNRMVNDLLVLAKAGREDFLAVETVPLDEFTEDLAAKAAKLGDRDWRLDAKGKGLIEADRQRLTQAVMQLAQNAVQHTKPGDLIAIGTYVANGQAQLWVRDSGPGVTPENRERIFDRFARATASRRASDGAGLGLSIVRAIAVAHHGHVELDSRPGAGATFTIVIPVDQPPQEEA